jgi:hypothetical protein
MSLKRTWIEPVVAYLKVISRNFLAELGKPTKNFSWYSRSPGRDWNLGPPKHKALNRDVWSVMISSLFEHFTTLYSFLTLCSTEDHVVG